ncbi:MAG TPA: oxaloacetate decarboxylase [bacterium]|nr:oxaloacetate decarboxylase [bacterium]
MNKAQEIRELLKESGTVIMPGVYDALTARIGARAGCRILFITGYSVSATYLGEPDFGLLTQSEMMEAARRICRVVETPVVVDVDTGYGNAINVMRTVKEVMAAGAAGIFLEDQVWPKRCGHMKGKQVIPLEEYLQKLKAARDARAGGDLFIVARTDARQAHGIEEAIRRGRMFHEAGADAVFIEAPESIDEMKEIARSVPGPLVANMIERGVTPLLSLEELRALGFHLIVWPLAPLYAAAKALNDVYSSLSRQGTTQGILERLISFDEFHEIVGLQEKYAMDQKYRAT